MLEIDHLTKRFGDKVAVIQCGKLVRSGTMTEVKGNESLLGARL